MVVVVVTGAATLYWVVTLPFYYTKCFGWIIPFNPYSTLRRMEFIVLAFLRERIRGLERIRSSKLKAVIMTLERRFVVCALLIPGSVFRRLCEHFCGTILIRMWQMAHVWRWKVLWSRLPLFENLILSKVRGVGTDHYVLFLLKDFKLLIYEYVSQIC